MSTCQSFAPVVHENCKILILGSMPGVKSLAEQQYYAHPQNRFWKMLAALFNEAVPVDYEDKLALLRDNDIALWDVLAYCQRQGSLDSGITDEVPNDIIGLLRSHPQITAVFCNGGKASSAFKKYFLKSVPEQVQVFYLHSTSPANARMSLQALVDEWSVIKDFLAAR